MRWSSVNAGSAWFDTTRRGGPLISAASFLTLSALLLSGFSADEKRLSIYSPTANYSLLVIERNGQDYVGLLEVLEPLGKVSAKDERRRWKLRYNSVAAEFTVGKTRARIQGRDFELTATFVLENGRGLVPLTSVTALLPRFLGSPVLFHETARRLFIGNVAVHFTAQVSKTNPAALVINFTSPVSPMISTEPGKLRMVFTREPLVASGPPVLAFDSKLFPSASYQESNGAAEIAVLGTAPLFANFSSDGRTITIAPAPRAASSVPTPPPVQQAGTPAATSQVQPGNTLAGANMNRLVPYFAIVDASHGGEERGAALTEQLAEKDITLAFARRLRQELAAHGLSVLLLRDSDTTVTLDQRATMTNSAHPAIYISVHAASQGTGIRLYTALLPAGGENRGPFLDWHTAQSAFRPLSQTAAASVAAEFMKRQIAVRSLLAPLRPLNNITTAAVALEVAPPAGGISDLNSPAYQQAVAEAVTAGLAAARDKLEARR